jgi:LemA protein
MDAQASRPSNNSVNQQRKKFIVLFAIGALVLIIIVWLIATRNALVDKEEAIARQWSEVQSTYQRRLNLIPNLVSVVQNSTEFEKTTLIDVINARAKAAQTIMNGPPTAEGLEQQTAMQDSLAQSANRAIAVIENYPDLKAGQQFRGLQAQLEGTERRIKFARSDFNKAVFEYNSKVRSFPTSIVANIFGFKRKEGFTADADADKAVEIKF